MARVGRYAKMAKFITCNHQWNSWLVLTSPSRFEINRIDESMITRKFPRTRAAESKGERAKEREARSPPADPLCRTLPGAEDLQAKARTPAQKVEKPAQASSAGV